MTKDTKTPSAPSSAPISTKQFVQIDKGLHGAANLRPQRTTPDSQPSQSGGKTTGKE